MVIFAALITGNLNCGMPSAGRVSDTRAWKSSYSLWNADRLFVKN